VQEREEEIEKKGVIDKIQAAFEKM